MKSLYIFLCLIVMLTALTSAEDDELENIQNDEIQEVEGQNDGAGGLDFFSKLPRKAADVPNLTKKITSFGFK